MDARLPDHVVAVLSVHSLHHGPQQHSLRVDRLPTRGESGDLGGRGVASALARFVTEQADAAGLGCYAETLGDGTEALYRGFGFEVRERWEIVPGAPMARKMWRAPRPSEPVTDSA